MPLEPVASAGVHAPAAPPPASSPSLVIPVERAAPNVVMSDAHRFALAFENGPVGRPPEPLTADGAEAMSATAPAPTSNVTVGGGGGDPPPPPAALRVTVFSFDSLGLTYRCGDDGASSIVRTNPDGSQATLPTVCAGQRYVLDSGLQPGTRYCYGLHHDTSATTNRTCVSTTHRPYMFNGPGVSQAESDQMAAQFDWSQTDATVTTLSTSAGTKPALYSMNVLVKNAEDLDSIRSLGTHTQTQPLFSDERPRSRRACPSCCFPVATTMRSVPCGARSTSTSTAASASCASRAR